MMRLLFPTFFVSAFLLLSSGCPQGATCALNGDCNVAELCIEGACVATCNRDDDCGTGACSNGLCVPADTSIFDDSGPFNPPLLDGGTPIGTDGGGLTPPTNDGGTHSPAPDGGSPDVAADGGRPIDPINDAGRPVAGEDAGPLDGGPVDAGPVDGGPVDGGPVDAGVHVFVCAIDDIFGNDLNGDCIPDLVIGAPGQIAAPTTNTATDHAGSVTVFLGDEAGSFVFLNTILAADNQIPQKAAFGGFGTSISLASEINGNRRREILIGEPAGAFAAGRVFTCTVDSLQESLECVTPGTYDLAGDLLGTSAVLVGPPNDLRWALGRPGDGLGEVSFGLVGAPPAGVLNDTTNVLSGSGLGNFVGKIADITGDGVEEIVISGPSLTDDGNPFGVKAVRSVAPYDIVQTWATPPGSVSFGKWVSSVGDLDGDGLADVAIGAPDDAPSGRVFLGLSTDPGALVEVTAGFGVVSENAAFGSVVIPLGDFDGDGRNELLIGAPMHSTGGDDATCDSFSTAGTNYQGDCQGKVLVLKSNTVTTYVEGGSLPTAVSCIDVSTFTTNLRLGSALYALGPHPVSGFPRVAMGAPGVGEVTVLPIGDAPGAGCTIGEGQLTVSSSDTGDLFGGVLPH